MLLTIGDLAKMLIKISGKYLTIELDLKKPQGVGGRNADLALVEKVLCWKPETSLEEGLKYTYQWIWKQIHN